MLLLDALAGPAEPQTTNCLCILAEEVCVSVICVAAMIKAFAEACASTTCVITLAFVEEVCAPVIWAATVTMARPIVTAATQIASQTPPLQTLI